ncbi:phosphatidylserine decarboxylase family, partial [Paramuricea clavata]
MMTFVKYAVRVNKLFKDILNYWGKYLSSPESTYVLTDDPRSGWFGTDAMEAMPNFVKEFECDPKKPHYGYKSWDDFFVRKYRPGIRPVEAPDDDYVIANACESAPFKLAREVCKRDWFWIKNQQYSLDHMLNNHDLAAKFYGGTVYQAFLSATSYHRWHSPVSGLILKTEVVDGSYYSQTYNIQTDAASPNESQAYLCQVAARGIIYILADNPDIGLMVFVSIGMSEVSTNEITVKTGDHVKKGDELGMFHFGGSTHCLVFQPHVHVDFDLRGQTPGTDEKLFNIPVRSKIAVVKKPKGGK